MEGRVAHLLSNWVVHAFSGTLSLVIWRIAQDIKNWKFWALTEHSSIGETGFVEEMRLKR